MAAIADALVVGAGVVGTSIALELTRAGLKVFVVDKAAGPGHGSTSASSAIVRFNYSTWEGVACSWESRHRWARWEDHLGYRDPNGLARFHRRGMVFLDAPIAPRSKVLALFDAAGIPYEEWDAATLRSRLPGIDVGAYYPPKPVTDAGFFAEARDQLGAVFTPDAGYVDDPRLAAANLAAAARHRGARFGYRRTVVALARRGDVWHLDLDTGDSLEAPVVVNATGPWSSALNRLVGAEGDFTIGVRPMRQEVHHVALNRLVGAEGDFTIGVRPMRQEVHHVAAPPGLTPTDAFFPAIADVDLGTYLRPDAGGNMLVGGIEPECDPLEWVTDPDLASPLPTVERFEAQVLRAARRFPDLGVPNRPRGIAGVYDVADDWTPIYDRTALPGFYVAIGTSGNQFKNAPTIGSLMAELITRVEGGHDHDRDPVRFRCPTTRHEVNLGAFSRRRDINTESSGTVLG
jgi:sarcosine oxidase, subunit beta